MILELLAILSAVLLAFAGGACIGWIECTKAERRRTAERAIARVTAEMREPEIGGVVRDLRRYRRERERDGAA
jgi:hypothetical protein